jgi:surface antigen
MAAIGSFMRVTPVHAADADTYSWPTAPCAHTGAITGACFNYDWGVTTCPTGDTYRTSQNMFGNYYLYDNWGYGFRNCTSYVAQKISQQFNGRSVAGWGNAKDWWSAATGNGVGSPYTSDDGNPQTGDIAVWTTGTYGHVAYVASVTNSVATFDEYNAAATGEFTNSYTSVTHPQP